MNKFIVFAFVACVALAICSPVDHRQEGKSAGRADEHKNNPTEKKEGKREHSHRHVNLTEDVKNSLRQAWNETSPEAQKACEENKALGEDYKKFREGLKSLTEEEQDAKIQARWDSLTKEEQVCIFHKMEQRKQKHQEEKPKDVKKGDNKNQVRGKREEKREHHHRHLNLTEEVKQSLRQAWNETSPEAQKACEENKTIGEDYKKFREGLKNLTEEEQDAKIQARWDSLTKEEQVCIFHKREQRKQHHEAHEKDEKRNEGNKTKGNGEKNKKEKKTDVKQN